MIVDRPWFMIVGDERGWTNMTLDNPATGHWDLITRPLCPECGAQMLLSRVEPEAPGHEKWIFECSGCDHESCEIAKIDNPRQP
jgi:hypothetical protein